MAIPESSHILISSRKPLEGIWQHLTEYHRWIYRLLSWSFETKKMIFEMKWPDIAYIHSKLYLERVFKLSSWGLQLENKCLFTRKLSSYFIAVVSMSAENEKNLNATRVDADFSIRQTSRILLWNFYCNAIRTLFVLFWFGRLNFEHNDVV